MEPFYRKNPRQIVKTIILQNDQKSLVNIQGIELELFSHVYPSQCFRTTNFLLQNIKNIINNKVICDMGCGIGIVGQYALYNDAKMVVQADINFHAIKNAIANRKKHQWTTKQCKIYKSDCFDNIPKQIFDVIIFNIPFHSEPYEIHDVVEYSLFDPNFFTLKKFLFQTKKYSHSKTKIIIAFSNKGDISTLEAIFDYYGYEWKLWKNINQHKKYDNRLYLLKL